MNHNDVRHKLSAYIDNAVSGGEKAEIEEHLKTCVVCSSALAELRKTIEQVKEIEEIEAPAWMTGKIMAQVRAEAEQKKGLFRRFFHPLLVKVPIQTVAVLFLAVTAYYIYHNINPAEKYPEAPGGALMQKEVPATSGTTKEEKIVQAPEPLSKKIGQKQEYKALDMKDEYEKPAPPVSARESAAPAPAPAAPAQAPAAEGGAAVAPEAKMMRSMAHEEAMDKAGQAAAPVASAKAKSAVPGRQMVAKSAVSESDRVRITLSTADVAGAEKEINRFIQGIKGVVIGRETRESSRRLIISMNGNKLLELIEELEKLGKLKDQDRTSANREGLLQVEITLTTAPHP